MRKPTPVGDPVPRRIAYAERLPSASIIELRKVVARIFPKESPAARRRLMIQLRRVMFAFFCLDEVSARQDSRTFPHEQAFKVLLKRIDAVLDRLHRLSPEARASFDFKIEPGFQLPLHFLKAARPFRDRSGDKIRLLTGDDSPRPPAALPPAPKTTFYVDPARLMLMRLRERITWELPSARHAGGRPLTLPWHNLAYHIASAMYGSLCYQPTDARNGKFERLLAECLRIGLDTIGASETVPSDLRPYTRRAIRDLRGAPSRGKTDNFR